MPDVLSESEAWLVPPEDPNALAEAVREALGDPEAAHERSRRARERLRRDFDATRWAERYLEIYRALLPDVGSQERRAAAAEGDEAT